MLYFCLFPFYFSFVKWRTSHRQIPLDRPLVMGILNVTPDSFSDGGRFANPDEAIAQAERMISEGADIIDIGGESTRPGSERIPTEIEIRRAVPVIGAVAKRFEIPISIDTTKEVVARAGVEAGAEIINDISGLRWEPGLAAVAAGAGAGIVLMHSRGEFSTMHSQEPVADIISEVAGELRIAIARAKSMGVQEDQIALDVGIGFGKTQEQNLELLARLDEMVREFPSYPMLAGVSRKSFLGRLLGEADPERRLGGSIAAATIAVLKGASIIRVHDVRETVSALRTILAIERFHA